MIPRVLIVDDVEETRSALVELLEASGEFAVAAEAADGREAIERARALRPDLVLMDIRMPNLDGIKATRAIVSEGIDCQVIAHSAYQDVSLVRDMIAAGAKGYVLKGSDADRLLATLHAALNGHAVLSPEVTRALLDDLQVLYSDQLQKSSRLEERVDYFQDAAMRDHLTSLGNHRAFHEDLEVAIRKAETSKQHLVVAMLDLDDFKLVNDLYGHATGDRLIADVGTVIADVCGEAGRAYRIGGDELAVIMLDTDAAAGQLVMESVRQGVEAMQSGQHRHQTISIGLASYPEAGINKDVLVSAADEAMYDAKSRGKNVVYVYGERASSSRAGRRETDGAVQGAVVTVVAALGARDANTMEHCGFVSSLAAAIAEELELTPAEIETVRLGALLHDVGKIGIPDDVLLKRGKLTLEERAQIQQHPDVGRLILGRALPRAVVECVGAHHEQPDGNGYPLGLRAGKIPLCAGIVRVADVFESMTRTQPWREAMDPAAALGELQRGAGTLFDDRAVVALVALQSRMVKRAA